MFSFYKFVLQEIRKDPQHLQLWKIYRTFSHVCYMFRPQHKIMVLRCCCTFIQNSIKYFYIYCQLPLVCFCITPFGTCSSPCIKLYILCCGLHFWLCLLAIPIFFPSLQNSASHHIFGTVIIGFQLLFMYSFFVQSFLSATILNFYFTHFELCITQVVS